MKKITLILMLVLFFLSGCSENNNDIIDELDGEYYYVKVIYLASYSSSSPEYYPNLPGSLIIEFTEDQIVYYGNNLEETITYSDIEFRKEDVNKDLDAVINLDFDGVFENFEHRYDIYSDDRSVGLTIFIDEETFYLAETRMIGGSHDIFSVYCIIEIEQ